MNDFASWNIPSIYLTLLTFQLFNGWLNDFAFANIPPISSTLLTTQLFNGWLNDFAFANISFISSTLLTFHLFNGWLNDFASWNIPSIFLTLLTFQLFNGWLKDFAPLNISLIFSTLLIFQLLISSLNSFLNPKRPSILVTLLVSHVDIWPYFSVAFILFLNHSSIAIIIDSFVCILQYWLHTPSHSKFLPVDLKSTHLQESIQSLGFFILFALSLLRSLTFSNVLISKKLACFLSVSSVPLIFGKTTPPIWDSKLYILYFIYFVL